MAEETGVVEYRSRDGQDIRLTIDTIKKYLVRGKAEYVTGQEFLFFMMTCKAKGMNPFINDCYLVKYTQNDPAAIITSIDYYRKRARSRPDCQGWKNGIIVMNRDNEIEEREGAFITEGEKLLGAWFSAAPVGWPEPMKWSVPLKPFIKKTREGNVTRFWSEENQPSQIAKVAESQGLRKIWSDEFQGLYVDAEIQSEGAQMEFDNLMGMGPLGETPADQKEDPAVINEKFNDIMPKNISPKIIDEFLERAAKGNKITVDQAKAEAVKKPEDFLKILRAYAKSKAPPKVAKKQEQPKPVVEEKEEEAEPEPLETVTDEDEEGFAKITCPYDNEVMTEVFCNTECMKRPACKAWK